MRHNPGVVSSAITWAMLLSASSAAAQDWPAIETRGVLRVLAVDDLNVAAFFAVGPDGQVDGFDAELLTGFADLHGLAIEVVPVDSWNDIVPALETRRGDVLAGNITVTPERARRVRFTEAVFPTGTVAANRQPAEPLESLADLGGLRIGVVPGSSMAEDLRRASLPDHRVVAIPTSSELIQALDRGDVDAILWGLETALLQRRTDPRIQVGVRVGAPQSLAFAVHNEAPQLLEHLNAYLAQVRRSGSWNRLVVKYFGDAGLEAIRRSAR